MDAWTKELIHFMNISSGPLNEERSGRSPTIQQGRYTIETKVEEQAKTAMRDLPSRTT